MIDVLPVEAAARVLIHGEPAPGRFHVIAVVERAPHVGEVVDVGGQLDRQIANEHRPRVAEIPGAAGMFGGARVGHLELRGHGAQAGEETQADDRIEPGCPDALTSAPSSRITARNAPVRSTTTRRVVNV